MLPIDDRANKTKTELSPQDSMTVKSMNSGVTPAGFESQVRHFLAG